MGCAGSYYENKLRTDSPFYNAYKDNPLLSGTKVDGLLIGGANVKLAKCTDGTSNNRPFLRFGSSKIPRRTIREAATTTRRTAAFCSQRSEPPNSMRGDELAWVSSKNDVSQAPIAEEAEGGSYFMTVRSYHPGGANVGRADGSVELVSERHRSKCVSVLGSRDRGD